MARVKRGKDESEAGVRRRRTNELVCGQCVIWPDIPTHFRDLRNKTRQCLPGSRTAITFRTEACDRFEMATSFWCSKLGQYTAPVVCLGRREGKGIYEYYTDIRRACRACDLGNRIDNFLNAPLIIYDIRE